ncbi:cysteine desulfurase family protein [Nakamurella sp.]|uniref:cysteine desulfurase family protein n=1 Tax=Nakamurella sp. TaxID=1869182 RepID=UPI003B3B3F5C
MATPTGTHPGLIDGPIYLDHNATTPIDPAVVAAMLPWLTTGFGNPSSGHRFGAAARAAVADARRQVADLVGLRTGPGERAGRIVFTGSGSEADALAVRGVVLADPRGRRHVVTQVTEHPAVLAACAELRERHGVSVTVLPVGPDGRVDPDRVAAAITPETALVSIMHANNETGVRQPVADLARIARERGVPMHCDAAQSIGKVPVGIDDLGVDLLTVVGHKMYAPAGVAALAIAPGVALRPLVGGGGQEGGLRAGTENVSFIVGLGRAAALARSALAAGETARLAARRDELAARLHAALPGRVTINGAAAPRLPNTLNVRIAGAPGLLDRLPDLAASAGSACHAGADAPSPVLTAMGLPAAAAAESIRLSVGRWTTPAEIERAAGLIVAAAG